MEKVLVTGGAGYIGSHTCKQLSKSNYEPIVFDNLSTGYKKFVKWGPLIVGDVRDTEHLKDIFLRYKPIAVIHFAAHAYVNESILYPNKYYSNNVAGTISLIQAMISCNIRFLVFSSTCAIYGITNAHFIDEKVIQNPINPYGQSKQMIEKILIDVANTNKLQFISLRYFNAAGADHELEIGEMHKPETHLIPLAIASSKINEKKLKIFGTNYNTPDGSAVRDYIHVEDLATGHIAALRYLNKNNCSDFFNLGSSKGTSVLEIITNLKNLGIDVNFIEEDKRVGDPPNLVANISKAKNKLGWKPSYKEINDILKTAILWHSK